MVVRVWQLAFSSWLAPSCRFVPSCSDYAKQAVITHGVRRGGWLAVKRLARCHPFGGSGIDEVPSANQTSSTCSCSAVNRTTDS
jgi:putative membrane protein insertion efficiency factor